MQVYFDLYGFLNADIDSIASTLGESLGVQFIPRENSDIGEYYGAVGIGDEEFVLQHNFNEIEQIWTEPEFEQWPIILYVNATRRTNAIEEIIEQAKGTKATLLRREEYQLGKTSSSDAKD